MNSLKEKVSEREQFLVGLIKSKKAALIKVPEGILRVSPRGKTNQCQYYHVTDASGPNGNYIKKSQIKLIHALAQKEYDVKTLKSAEKELKTLSQLSRIYQSGQTVEECFCKMSNNKRSLITPIELTDDMYVRNWLSEPFERLDAYEKPEGFISDNNENMRSKSEVLIANCLKKHGVPYRYECIVKIGGKSMAPDFIILNTRTRKEILWEHLGLLDNSEYLERSIEKLTLYEMNGFFPGDNLIITFETSKHQLNTLLLNKTIEKYCL